MRLSWLALLPSVAGFAPLRLPLSAHRRPWPSPFAPGFSHGHRAGVAVAALADEDEAVERRKNPGVYAEARASAALAQGSERLRVASRKRPQVLAPAGGWEQLAAAVQNGADAVYFGLQPSEGGSGSGLNARARADNFRDAELPEILRFLHRHGVKGYLTLNVLVFEEEMAQARRAVLAAARAGVDALIIQDVGLARLAKELAPALPVHASTQMSVTSAQGVHYAAEQLNVSRVVLARELSWREIQKVTEAMPRVEVEVFVHGALCVSYSGQCFSSEAWGGRSANRGQCAQGCRMPYGLLVNGTLHHLLEDVKYLLSPQDLMALDLVPELMNAGVACLKIEGRLKGPGYVALATQAYRSAVDAAWRDVEQQRQAMAVGPAEVQAAGGTLDFWAAGSSDALQRAVDEEEDPSAQGVLREGLRQVFARAQDETFDGLSLGYLNGTQHQGVVRGRNPRHRGLCLGRIARVHQARTSAPSRAASSRAGRGGRGGRRGGRGCGKTPSSKSTGGDIVVDVDLTGDIRITAGDGVVFEHDDGPDSGAEQGGVVFALSDEAGAGMARLVFRRGSVDPAALRVGGLVWRTRQVDLEKQLPAIIKGDVQLAPAPSSTSQAVFPSNAVRLRLAGGLGQPLSVELTDTRGRVGAATTASALEVASGSPISKDTLLKAIGELGEYPLRIATVDVADLDLASTGLFLPLKDVKQARRDAAEALLAAREVTHVGKGLRDGLQPAPTAAAAPAVGTPTPVHWSLLCRTPEQVDAACAVPWLPEVALDFLEIHGLREACAAVRRSGKRVVVATPRVLKPGEDRLWRFYLGLEADALLVRSTGMLQQLYDLGGPGARHDKVVIPELHGDFSLNIANHRAAELVLSAPDGRALSRITPTHDLNAEQVCRLAGDLETAEETLEVIVHQHLPVSHTEHCVFCRFLSDGNSYKDCGHPCESNRIHLRDEAGQDHLVLADMGCRNTVFNAKAQSALPVLRDLLAANVRLLRIELVDEPAASVGPLLESYRAAADAMLAGDDAAVEAAVDQGWDLLGRLPDANGRPQGVDLGSLAARQEVRRRDMKETAYQAKRKKEGAGAASAKSRAKSR